MLSVSALEKTYRASMFQFRRWPPRVVLRGVDLSVRSGEILGLVGSNGAGKTTLLHCILGLTTPDRGRVLLDGRELGAVEARRAIGLCSSADRGFYYRLTMRENLSFFAQLHGISGSKRKRRVDTLLQLLSLDDVADRRYAECSSGMRQRLALARALLHDPPVLLLDEPTRSLDPLRAYEFRGMVRSVFANVERKTIVLATNILEEAWSISDRIALLGGGRIVAMGPPAAIRERVRREFSIEGIELSV